MNLAARRLGRPGVDMLDDEEVARIEALITTGTYPDGWAGDEPTADMWLDAVFPDGTVQPVTFAGHHKSFRSALRHRPVG